MASDGRVCERCCGTGYHGPWGDTSSDDDSLRRCNHCDFHLGPERERAISRARQLLAAQAARIEELEATAVNAGNVTALYLERALLAESELAQLRERVAKVESLHEQALNERDEAHQALELADDEAALPWNEYRGRRP